MKPVTTWMILRDLVHEHHDGVVDREDRRDEAGARDEHGDQLRDRLLHDRVDDEVGDAADHHVLQVGELLLDLVPGRGRAVAHQRHDDVEAGLQRLDRRSRPTTLTSLPRMLAQVSPSTREHELADLRQRERLRDVDARQRAGEPVDQAGLEVVAEVVGEVLEAELGGLDQVADERQRVLEDALERGAGLLDVAPARRGSRRRR